MDVHDVVSFERAEDALAAFVTQQPDLVISDLIMPGMDGIGLRKALDGVENGNTTPFIFLSGRSASEHNSYISELGVDDFLCKPVSAARRLHRSRQIRNSVQSKFHHDITELLKPQLPARFGAWKLITCHTPA